MRKKFWIITFTCTFSKFTRIEILKSLDSKSVFKALKCGWLNKYVSPKELLTDQGKSYLNDYFTKNLEKYKIKHIKTSAYNPEANGISERINAEILKVLRMYKGKELSKIIKMVHRKLNNTYHFTIKCIPNVLIKQKNLINIGIKENKIVSEEVEREILKEHGKNNLKQNKNRIAYNFVKGMMVLIQNTELGKLADLYCAPMKLLK